MIQIFKINLGLCTSCITPFEISTDVCANSTTARIGADRQSVRDKISFASTTIIVCSGPFLPTSKQLSESQTNDSSTDRTLTTSMLPTSSFHSSILAFPNLKKKSTLQSVSTSLFLKINRSYIWFLNMVFGKTMECL